MQPNICEKSFKTSQCAGSSEISELPPCRWDEADMLSLTWFMTEGQPLGSRLEDALNQSSCLYPRLPVGSMTTNLPQVPKNSSFWTTARTPGHGCRREGRQEHLSFVYLHIDFQEWWAPYFFYDQFLRVQIIEFCSVPPAMAEERNKSRQ